MRILGTPTTTDFRSGTRFAAVIVAFGVSWG